MTTKMMQKKEKESVQTTGELTREGLYFTPNSDIFETDSCVYLTMDMPGVSNENIDINVKDHELQIQGRVKNEEVLGNPLISEYRVGNFIRTFQLTHLIDVDRIEAKISNGVLRVELPKSEAAKPRKITITHG